MKSTLVLVLVTWLTATPIVDTATCRAVMGATADMIRSQADSNLTCPHRPLQMQPVPAGDELVLRTPTVGHELARLRCVTTDAPESVRSER